MPDHRRLLELLEEYKRECGQDVFLKGEDGRVVASTCAPAAVLLRAAVTEQISSKELRRRAEMLGEEATGNRCLFLLETEKQDLSGVKDVVAGLFGENEKHYLIEAEPGILAAAPRMDELDPEEFREMAEGFLAVSEGEAGVNVRVAYGSGFSCWEELPDACRKARLALSAGRIFYRERRILPYSELELAAFVVQLPPDFCREFLKQMPPVFAGDGLEEELVRTAAALLENRLNGAETARQLYIHRNTLTYRLDKIKKLTGWDLRRFEDAAAYSLAMMIAQVGKEKSDGSIL